MVTYTYTKAEVGASQLAAEIQSSSITIALDYVNTSEETSTVDAVFKAALSGAEQTTLSGIVDAHVADTSVPPETVILGHTKTDGTVETDVHTTDGKLRVLSSHKPTQVGKTFYNFFSSVGDDWENGVVGSGTLMQIQTSSGSAYEVADLKFMNYNDPTAIIWLFGGAFAWENAGWGDSICAEVRAKPTPVVPRVVATGLGLDVDYNLDGERIAYAGPDAGDYALGGYPSWVPDFQHTGHWDLDKVAMAAIPNMTETGDFDWYITEQSVGRYIASILIYGSSHGFTHIDATESTPIPYGHFLRIEAHNASDTDWKMWGYANIYREHLR